MTIAIYPEWWDEYVLMSSDGPVLLESAPDDINKEFENFIEKVIPKYEATES